MKLGILGAGGIASTMAKTVAGMKNVEAYAGAARDMMFEFPFPLNL